MLKINLQFFAEDTGAEDSVMEAFGAGLLDDDDGFEGFGETGEMGAEDVPQEPEDETTPEGGGDAEGGAGGETQETPAEEPAAGGAGTEAAGGMTVEVGGVMVPAEAMQALSGALGQDASELIRRGMAYEQKGARELHDRRSRRRDGASGGNAGAFRRARSGCIGTDSARHGI